MQDDDFSYFSRRSEQEAELAARTLRPHVAAVHRRLSELYAERAATLAQSAPVAPADPIGPHSG